MTKAKKVLSLVLAVVMVAAMFAFSASAATENATFTVSVDKTPVTVGEEITVTVALTTDYYVGPTSVPVYYNPAVFEFVADSVAVTPLYGAAKTDVTTYNDAATGCLKVAMYADVTGADGTAQYMNGTLFTFRLRAIANGTSDIGLKAEDQKTATNVGGTLYCGAYASSEPDNNPATVGQAFTINNTTATVGMTANPELVVIAGTTGVIDAENKYVYGVTPGDAATLYFEATNGGSVKMAVNDADCDFGTGATLQLLAADGNTVLDTYTLIIFGDVNGDGSITGVDATKLDQYSSGATSVLSGAALIAADVNADGSPTGVDATKVDQYAGGATSAISQTVGIYVA